MSRRIIKEGEPMDPIQVGDIITLELKDGSILTELLAVEAKGSSCAACYMLQEEGHFGTCSYGWKIRNQENYGSDFCTDVALCCTKPVFSNEDNQQPEFCRFIKLDTILENL